MYPCGDVVVVIDGLVLLIVAAPNRPGVPVFMLPMVELDEWVSVFLTGWGGRCTHLSELTLGPSLVAMLMVYMVGYCAAAAALVPGNCCCVSTSSYV